jgi:hypothetical protein
LDCTVFLATLQDKSCVPKLFELWIASFFWGIFVSTWESGMGTVDFRKTVQKRCKKCNFEVNPIKRWKILTERVLERGTGKQARRWNGHKKG